MEQEELRETIYSVYARPNEDGFVTHIFSDCFEQPRATDIFLKSGYGDEFVHVGGGNPCTIEGLPRYKIEHGEMIERSAEELERERSNCLQKQLELEKERNYQMVTDVLTETVSNDNLVINPDFNINQRDGYVVKEGSTVYFDTEFTQVANESLPHPYEVTGIFDNYATLETLFAPTKTTLYAKLEDITEGYYHDNYNYGNKFYKFDRWFIRGYITLEKKEDGVIFKKLKPPNEGYALLGTIIEGSDKMEGEELTVTLSINDSVCFGTVSKGWTYENNEKELIRIRGFNNFNGSATLLTTPSNFLEVRIYLSNALEQYSECKVSWVKVEHGSVSTRFIPPQRSSELIKCKYFYQEIETISNVHIVSKDKMIAFVPYSPMKTVPELSFKNNYFNTYDDGVCITDAITGNRIEGFTFKLYHSTNIDSISINAEKANHGLNKTTCFFMTGRRNKICLSAENK